MGGKQKDSRLTEDYKAGRKVTLIGSLTNLLLTAVKIFAGYVGGSSAMIADGLHSLSDLATDVGVLISLKLASMPEDDTHPYGHGKIETFGAMAIGIVLIAVAVQMFISGGRSLLKGESTTPTVIALFAAVISIVSKEWLYRYTAEVGKQTGQTSLIANAWHHRTDAFSSIAALVGIAGAMMGAPYFDQLAAMAVSIMVVQAGANIGWKAFGDLIDASVEPEIVEALHRTIDEMKEVLSYHALRTRRLGSKIMVDVHIQLPAETTVAQGHYISGKLKRTMMGIHKSIGEVLIHTEPDTGCSLRPCLTLAEADLYNAIRQVVLGTEGITCIHSVDMPSEKNGGQATLWIDFDPKLGEMERKNALAFLIDRLERKIEITNPIIHIGAPRK